jgi:hypothetical protein
MKIAELAQRAHQRAPRDRDTVRAEHLLHAVLVAEVAGDGGVDPLDAERVARLGHRHLELLERARQPVDPPDAWRRGRAPRR